MIRIARNEQGNCINFYGSSNPTHWNACLSGQVDPQDNTLVNVVNDITTSQAGTTQYEFFNIPFTEFLDEENNVFANAQEVADYITLKGNVTVGTGVNYKGIWNADTNTPDLTTDTSGFNAGDFYKIIAIGTADLGSGNVEFINGDEVIFDGTDWVRKPYAGALIEYDSTSVLLNNNAAVYADGAQGLEEPNGAEQGWYFKNDESGKKVNWYYLGNENAGYQMNKATLQGGYIRLRVLTAMGVDSPFFSLYTTPKGDGFDAFWFRSRYVYNGDFTGVAVNQEVIAYWGEDPSVSPELTRVELTLDNTFSLLSGAPDISNDTIYTMALSTNSAATVDSIEFIAKELGYKNQQYLRSFLLEAKLENVVVPTNDNDLTGESLDFKLDATSTSIMLNNGFAYGVNTIKAVDTGDGLITIKSMQGDLTHFIKLDHTNVTLDGDSISGGLNDVINTLNELFTVGAFQSVVISDPYSTMIADIDGVDITANIQGTGGTDPIGNDVAGGTATSSNNAGYLSVDTIDQVGEYFTFDIRGEGTIGFGLVHSVDSYNDGHWSGNQTYADPAGFANGTGNAHYGWQFSHYFHPSPNGSWTNYGANTSYSMRSGWSNFNGTDEQADWLAGNPIKMRVGIDTNGFISIETLRDGSNWEPHARTSYPVPQGSEFRLGIKFNDSAARLYSLPKVHLLEPEAPAMYFRYIESPDGVFNYPLFATAEEAEYYDEIVNGGDGFSHTHTYADDPTNTVWYMPEATHDASTYQHSSAPDGTETFSGNTVTYTEVTSLTNADLTPPQFSILDISQEEGTAVNIQVTPAGASWTTNVSITPSGSGLVYDNYSVIQGTLADVGADTIYTVTVTRANSYGSSVGTFDIQATDVAPVQTNDTPWTKALDFSGGSEYIRQAAGYYTVSPLHMNGYATNIAAPSNSGYTANGSSVRPWATAIVFKIDNVSANQHIWNSGEGAGNGDDNIYLRLDSSKKLYFGWGREGQGYNECTIQATALGHNDWYGVYIANNGTRQSGSNATATALAAMFDIRLMNSGSNNWTIGSNLSIPSAWTSTGADMDKAVTGDLTIGGRGSNRSFQGKVASMVVTTLRINQPMPTSAEVDLMITDPTKWLDDYKVGEAFRTNTSPTDYTGFAIGTESCYRATQVWLMGDGTYDAYPNGIRNQVGVDDQNTTEMQFNSMVSNDIETVNINGLT